MKIPSELEVAPRYKLLVNTVYTIHNLQTASYCLNSSLYACIYIVEEDIERYRNGLMSFGSKKRECIDEWSWWVIPLRLS